MYRVTYDTPTPPADLPAGAKVERIAREFPVKVTTPYNRELTVIKTGDNSVQLRAKRTTLTGGEVLSLLPTDVARELAHAILEGIGDPVPDAPAPAPTLVRDGDGDYWVFHPRSGKWKLTDNVRTELNSRELESNVGESLDYISRNYSGYTIVK